MVIKQISAEETYPLRRKVLRKNMPTEPHEFNGDFNKGTFHLGAFVDGEICGIVTMLPLEEGKVYQLRGMAVDDDFHGKNIGRKLVAEAEDICRKNGGETIWMNARENAIPFYEKCGYQKVGSLFTIPPIGAHIKMSRNLNDPAQLQT